jgi:hypothetical protein
MFLTKLFFKKFSFINNFNYFFKLISHIKVENYYLIIFKKKMSNKISIKEYLKKFSSISNKFVDNFFILLNT